MESVLKDDDISTRLSDESGWTDKATVGSQIRSKKRFIYKPRPGKSRRTKTDMVFDYKINKESWGGREGSCSICRSVITSIKERWTGEEQVYEYEPPIRLMFCKYDCVNEFIKRKRGS